MQNEDAAGPPTKLHVVPYTGERVPNFMQDGALPWQAYQTARNALLRCCQKFGTVGPMLECPITDDAEPPSYAWDASASVDCDFFVLDDQLNDEKYIYIEFGRPSVFTRIWIETVAKTLTSLPGWGVGLGASFRSGYVLIFEDRIMVTGTAFSGCTDLSAVVNAGQSAFNSS